METALMAILEVTGELHRHARCDQEPSAAVSIARMRARLEPEQGTDIMAAQRMKLNHVRFYFLGEADVHDLVGFDMAA